MSSRVGVQQEDAVALKGGVDARVDGPSGVRSFASYLFYIVFPMGVAVRLAQHARAAARPLAGVEVGEERGYTPPRTPPLLCSWLPLWCSELLWSPAGELRAHEIKMYAVFRTARGPWHSPRNGTFFS